MFEKQLLLTKSFKQNQQTFLGVPPTYADYSRQNIKQWEGGLLELIVGSCPGSIGVRSLVLKVKE